MRILKNKKLVIILSLFIIWLPTIIIFFFWKKLPDNIATHYNAQMVADGWSSKIVAVLLIPLIITVIQLLLVYAILRNPKAVKTEEIIFFFLPIISIFGNGTIFLSALGMSLQNYRELILNILFGILFIMLGLLMRDVKPNRIIGVRLPWTFQSKKNWKLTNRLAARLFLVGGILLILCGLLPASGLTWFIIALVIVVPIIYSYVLHRQGV